MNIDDLIKGKNKILKKHHDKFENMRTKNKTFSDEIKENIDKKQIEFDQNKKDRKSAFDSIRNK